ncbi:hypothetical protein QJQ45_016452 [Haematococcus lacustris]|nr:hypothetical protein QJQ45_016452 [Haematococcus lacustris]
MKRPKCVRTKQQLKHDSRLNKARRNTLQWSAAAQPQLQQLAAAPTAGTSLQSLYALMVATKATWDALEEEEAKQLVVFFGAAGIGSKGGWGADSVLRACCKVVCRPRGMDQRRGRVVLVDEHRTSRVSSTVNGQQPSVRQLNKRRATRPADWKPPAGQVEHRLVRPAWSQQRDQPVRGLMWCPVVAPRKPPQAPGSSQAGTQPAVSETVPSTPLPAKRSKRTKAEPEAAEPTQPTEAAKAKPAPQPGRWLDRDCNAALNMHCDHHVCLVGAMQFVRREAEALSMERYDRAKHVAVFGNTVIGIRGLGAPSFQQAAPQASAWGLMCCPRILPQPHQPAKQTRPPKRKAGKTMGKAATLPAASEPGPSTPPPATFSKAEGRLLALQVPSGAQWGRQTGKGKPVYTPLPCQPPSRWLDRDTNAVLSLQHVGDGRRRPLKLCRWPGLQALCCPGTKAYKLLSKRAHEDQA